MKKLSLLFVGLFVVMFFTSCSSTRNLSYVYDATSHKYVRLERSDSYLAKERRKDHTIYYSSNRHGKREFLVKSRNKHANYNVYPASAQHYTQILNRCPNGHPLDVTGFYLGDSVRCPDDNSIFPVEPDYRNQKRNLQLYYL